MMKTKNTLILSFFLIETKNAPGNDDNDDAVHLEAMESKRSKTERV